jgi:beta-lactamase regulating signal transducer with metallopeptidase domain
MTAISSATLGFLATYLVHSTLFLTIAWLLTRRLVRSPEWRETVWKSAVVGGLATSLLAQSVPWTPLHFTLPGVPQGAVLSAPFTSGTAVTSDAVEALGVTSPQETDVTEFRAAVNAAPGPVAQGDLSWATVLLAAWASTSLLLLTRLAWRRSRVMQGLPVSRVADVELLAIFKQLRSASGIRPPLRLSVAPGSGSPMVLAGGEICVPERFLTDLTRGEQRGALAHELAHLARGDAKWLTAIMVLECLFFFQPLQKVARRGIRDASEYLSDAWAARLVGDQESLARCLVHVAGWLTPGSPRLADAIAIVEGGSPIAHRVKRLLEGEWRHEPSTASRMAGALALIVAVGAFAPVVGAAREAQPGGARVPPGPVALDPVEATPSSETPSGQTPDPVEMSGAGRTEALPAPRTATPPTERLPDLPGADGTIGLPDLAGLATADLPRLGGATIEMELAARATPVQTTPVAREFRDPNTLTLVLPGMRTAGSQRVLAQAAAVGMVARGTAATEESSTNVVPTGRTADLFRTMDGVESLCDLVECRVSGRRGFAALNSPESRSSPLGGCDLQFFVDGVPSNGALPDLTIELIESVEVYNGVSQLPAQYHGPQARCGVVVIQTRR